MLKEACSFVSAMEMGWSGSLRDCPHLKIEIWGTQSCGRVRCGPPALAPIRVGIGLAFIFRDDLLELRFGDRENLRHEGVKPLVFVRCWFRFHVDMIAQRL